ncbi:putative N-acetyl neuraminate lyase [Operophtera brumata]|uniref:N-acetylneuraminate lyase n=1 Tax=Operophtera brumata TaxID=104452 RepID=A0A0L7L8A9_OPEBR|nr:putative N-acetyl neuraminate lyase [Operophtera brumata]
MSLAVADRKKVVDAWVVAGRTTRLHIQVQVGGAPLADVLDLAQYCQAAGVDSLLTLPELYFKPATVQDLVSYVELVAKAAPKLPVLYYHIPAMSKVEVNMPAFVVAATARIANFKGIKFTCNDLSEGAQVLRTLQDGQEMFLGADTVSSTIYCNELSEGAQLIAPAALLGIKSSIGTTFNLFPRLAQDILNAVERNDLSIPGPWVPIMKAGMEIATGIKVGPPSLPQRPISAEAKQRIQGKLRGLGLSK